MDICSDVSNDHETEILDGDSDVPTTSSHKQLWPCPLDFTSVQATSTEEEESSELDSYDDKTSQEAQGAGRIFKIWPVYEYCLQKCRSVYSTKKELSLDEAMTLWWGCLKFRRYKPWKVTKYEVQVRMVRVTVSDYTCIYTWRYTKPSGRSWRTQFCHFQTEYSSESSHLSRQFL